jgi:hypothetical protein
MSRSYREGPAIFCGVAVRWCGRERRIVSATSVAVIGHRNWPVGTSWPEAWSLSTICDTASPELTANEPRAWDGSNGLHKPMDPGEASDVSEMSSTTPAGRRTLRGTLRGTTLRGTTLPQHASL